MSSSYSSSWSSTSSSPLLCFPTTSPNVLERHVQSTTLGYGETWVWECWQVLKPIYDDDVFNEKGLFNAPVDDTYLPTYYQIVKSPMDLGTVKNKLEDDEYANPKEFAKDVRSVFANAQKFNEPGHQVHEFAKILLNKFDSLYTAMEKRVTAAQKELKHHTCESCESQACFLCGLKCLEFRHPQLRCSSPCRAKIQRNTVYWRLGGERGQHWCSRCHAALPETFLGMLGQKLAKSKLERCENNLVFMEPWIECARCFRWVHQICSMYLRQFQGKPAKTQFVCPHCKLEEYRLGSAGGSAVKKSSGGAAIPRSPRLSGGSTTTSPLGFQIALSQASPTTLSSSSSPITLEEDFRIPNAKALPHSVMGDFLEEKVIDAVVAELTLTPKNPGQGLQHPKFSDAEARKVADTITVRVVSNIISEGLTEPRLKRWMDGQARSARRPGLPPDGYPHREKTITVFQKIDGVDVLLFVMYVHEYGVESTAPNRGDLYISYLDSVAFMRPRRLRSIVYQQTLVSYFSYARLRGFRNCYIWACPPQRGDAYVMYCHPLWQRTPSADRLRRWYSAIVARSIEAGVVETETNLYEAHLSDYKPIVNTRHAVAATQSQFSKMLNRANKFLIEEFPIFSGDFSQMELEIILSQLETVHTDLAETNIRSWWSMVWGANAVVEIMAPPMLSKKAAAAAAAAESPFDSNGIPRPQPLCHIRPAVGELPDAQTMLRLERDCNCTFAERDDWVMRRLAASIKPLKENFMVLTFCDIESDSSTKRRKLSSSAVAHVPFLNGASDGTLLADIDTPTRANVFDSRLALLDFLAYDHLQFDSLRRAKYSSAALLCLLEKTLMKGHRGASAVSTVL